MPFVYFWVIYETNKNCLETIKLWLALTTRKVGIFVYPWAHIQIIKCTSKLPPGLVCNTWELQKSSNTKSQVFYTAQTNFPLYTKSFTLLTDLKRIKLGACFSYRAVQHIARNGASLRLRNTSKRRRLWYIVFKSWKSKSEQRSE